MVVEANVVIDRIVNLLHEHVNILEEARRGIALMRATRGAKVNYVMDSLHKLRLSRVKLLEELRAVRSLEGLGRGESEDLIALLGYYVEIAYANELSVLLEARDVVNVDYDLKDLEDLRREARDILVSLFNR